MAVNGGEDRLMRVNGRRYKKSREILDSFVYLQPLCGDLPSTGFRPIYSAAILQPLALCIEDALRGADDELAIDEVLINRFTVIHPFTDILE